jgi:hypothetical protein
LEGYIMSIPKSDIVPPQQYNLGEILQYTEPKKQGVFRRIIGSVAGGAANAVIPGVGTLIGSAIGGSIAGPSGGLLGDSAQFLQLQQQIQAETRAFETVSVILKSRHDAAMDAIRNIK